MIIKTFQLHGYSSYFEVLPEIQDILSVLKDPDYKFELGLNEAVSNAARYSVDIPETAEIRLDFRITDYDIVAKVSSKTFPCDMFSYRDKIRNVIEKKYSDATWTEYVAGSEKSRGLWYMLRGCEYIYMDSQAQSVRLCTCIPAVQNISEKMNHLILRFFIEKDGVLLL